MKWESASKVPADRLVEVKVSQPDAKPVSPSFHCKKKFRRGAC